MAETIKFANDMKKKTVFAAPIIISAALCVTGCNLEESFGYPAPVIDGGIELTRDQLKLVSHSNEFAFDLFRQVMSPKESDTKSYILSPISITYALGMLNNGAAGNTQAEINKVLGFEEFGADSINAFCKKMMDIAPKLDSLTKVMISNNIYVNDDYALMDDFVRKANTYYYAYPETRNFHDGKTMNVINKWASDHTEGMIPEILDDKSFNPYTVSYLLNAIYFKGTWKYKFDKSYTQDEDFYLPGNAGDVATRPMMHQAEEFYYAETNDYKALRLPYGNETFQMTILLPLSDSQPNNLPKIPGKKTWDELNKKMKKTQVDVSLPRFETDTDIDLTKVMPELGMIDAFIPNQADFRDFCDVPTYIDLMKQVAKIKLDEEGSEAAAVTVIGMRDNGKGEPGPKYEIFHADHPFLYVISEIGSGAIFFIGRYTGY